MSREILVLYVMDALRPDHLGCYGYQRPTSPCIDRMASEGILFENVHSHSTETKSSAATIYTSTSPSVHRTVSHQDCLPEGLSTLAQCLQKSGYATVGFNANFRISAQYGFDRGFDHYFDLSEEMFGTELDKVPPSDVITERILSHLDLIENDKVFLAVWAMDTHLPFNPPIEIASRFLRNEQDVKGSASDLLKAKTREDFDNLIDLYDAEICRNDQQIGILIDSLKSRGDWDNTTFILTADHGEMFLEHGHFIAHGGPPYRELTHVPLIMHAPGQKPHRRDGLHGLIDVMPTMLNLAGIEPAKTVQGRSLLDDEEEKAIICECYREKRGYSLGVFDRDYKLIVTNRRSLAGKGEASEKQVAPPPRDIRKFREEVLNNRIPTFTIRKTMALRALKDLLGVVPAKPRKGEWLRWTIQLIKHFAARERVELYDCRNDPAETKNIVVWNPLEIRRLRRILDDAHDRNRQLAESLRLLREQVESDEILDERLKHLGYID